MLALAAAIRVLPKTAIFSCPADFGPVTHVYLSDSSETIEVYRDLSGCRFVGNSAIYGEFTGADDPGGFLGIPTRHVGTAPR